MQKLVLTNIVKEHQYDQAYFPTVKHPELINPMLWYHFISETAHMTLKQSGKQPFVRTKVVLITSNTEQGGKLQSFQSLDFCYSQKSICAGEGMGKEMAIPNNC